MEFIKQNKMLFGVNISQFEFIETFIPKRFFIQNYVSYKKETKYMMN